MLAVTEESVPVQEEYFGNLSLSAQIVHDVQKNWDRGYQNKLRLGEK
jgi:hypothetical protein